MFAHLWHSEHFRHLGLQAAHDLGRHASWKLLAFREIVGGFGTLLYVGHDWADPQLARRSMELMAELVMPAVNAAICRVG